MGYAPLFIKVSELYAPGQKNKATYSKNDNK